MLSLEEKQKVFFATRTANFLASMRLEGLIVDSEAPLPIEIVLPATETVNEAAAEM